MKTKTQTLLDTVRDACMELIEEQGEELSTRELDLILKCNKKIRFALRKATNENRASETVPFPVKKGRH